MARPELCSRCGKEYYRTDNPIVKDFSSQRFLNGILIDVDRSDPIRKRRYCPECWKEFLKFDDGGLDVEVQNV